MEDKCEKYVFFRTVAQRTPNVLKYSQVCIEKYHFRLLKKYPIFAAPFENSPYRYLIYPNIYLVSMAMFVLHYLCIGRALKPGCDSKG